MSRKFHSLLIISPLLGAFCGAVGMFLSYYYDISSAATIVLTAAGLFIVVELVIIMRGEMTAAPR